MTQPHIVELAGRIDHTNSAEIEANIKQALDASPSALILDFSGVTFVSSIGLRVLLMTAKRSRKDGVKLALHSVPSQIAELFKLSGLSSFFTLYPDREAAVAACA